MLTSSKSESDVVERRLYKGSMSKECLERLVKIWSKDTTALPIFKDLPRLIRGVSIYENDQKVQYNTIFFYIRK